jgi:hypothetical protein
MYFSRDLEGFAEYRLSPWVIIGIVAAAPRQNQSEYQQYAEYSRQKPFVFHHNETSVVKRTQRIVYKHKSAYTVNVFSTPSDGDVYQTQPAEGFLFKYNQRNALNLTGITRRNKPV